MGEFILKWVSFVIIYKTKKLGQMVTMNCQLWPKLNYTGMVRWFGEYRRFSEAHARLTLDIFRSIFKVAILNSLLGRMNCSFFVRWFLNTYALNVVVVVWFLLSYDLNNLRLTHIKAEKDKLFINDGIDIKYFTESDEWDIVGIMAKLSEEPEIKENHFPGKKLSRNKTWV